MSTKASIYYDDEKDLHLYEELLAQLAGREPEYYLDFPITIGNVTQEATILIPKEMLQKIAEHFKPKDE